MAYDITKLKNLRVSDVIRNLPRVCHENVLTEFVAFFYLWSDGTEVYEEETAGFEPREGKGEETNAKIGRQFRQCG